MNPSPAERETSTLHTVCQLAAKHGPLTIVDLCALTDLGSTMLRAAANRGVELGYLRHGPKSRGKTNRRKTYARTRKRIAGAVEMPVAVPVSEFAPHRHPHDVWFFGDAPAVRASDIEGRVFRQPMNFDDGRDV
jgi:hypothetical protein